LRKNKVRDWIEADISYKQISGPVNPDLLKQAVVGHTHNIVACVELAKHGLKMIDFPAFRCAQHRLHFLESEEKRKFWGTTDKKTPPGRAPWWGRGWMIARLGYATIRFPANATEELPDPLQSNRPLYGRCAYPVHVCDPLRQTYSQNLSMGILCISCSFVGLEFDFSYLS